MASLVAARPPATARRSTAAAASPATAPLTTPVAVYRELTVPAPRPGPPAQLVAVADITAQIQAVVTECGVREGVATVVSKHTTTAITVNEWESRLVRDVEAWLLSLAPPDERSAAAARREGVRWLHNDIDQRPDSDAERARCAANGWDVTRDGGDRGLAAWRAQEPINAHSHLLAMLVGASEAVAVTGGELAVGQWQSVMLVDLDGPRERRVGVQVTGFK